MFLAHQKDAWMHTTHLLCQMANVARTDKSQPLWKFDDVYPFKQRSAAGGGSEIPIRTPEDMSVLKIFWLKACGHR